MTDERIYYAIGDIHGELDKLNALHAAIEEHRERVHPGAPITLVHLGDYVDRGPDSRGVVERLMELEAAAAERDDFDVINLRGNHEQMFLDAIFGDADRLDLWFMNGGRETSASYRVTPGRDVDRDGLFDRDHVRWVQRLPLIHQVEERGLVFVHAALDVENYPEGRDEIYMWSRSPKFFDDSSWPDQLKALTVVHGHTPTEDGLPSLGPAGRRIGVDTGACFGGPLTAVALAPGRDPAFLRVR